MSDEEDRPSKPAIVAKPIDRDDEDTDKPPVAKAAKPVDDDSDDDEDDDRGKGRDARKDRQYRDRDERYYGPPPQQYPPQYGPRAPFFSSGNFNKLISLALLIGIILLFIGTMCTAGAKLIKIDTENKNVEDDQDFQRNLYGAGIVIDGIGLFLISFLIILSLLLIKDLDEKQRMILIILLVGIIISFTFLALAPFLSSVTVTSSDYTPFQVKIPYY